MAPLNTTQIIQTKRDGNALSQQAIDTIIAGITDDSIPDYQVSALLMAIFWRGMTNEEMTNWTQAMLHSGEVLSHQVTGKCVDKHSTGGVGDKISIPLAPAVAACGGFVPMISGRGLGHTGGTLDKLESIPGFNVNLTAEAFCTMVSRLGVSMIGQTKNIAPADKRLYALRDVTSTVESVPLIASSIMSKKLAEGIDGLVLDCKVGTGAFMKNMADAKKLATAIMGIAKGSGKRCSVLLTEMDNPIGNYVGNALEMLESIEVLQGKGPADTKELTCALGGEMLWLAGIASSPEEGFTAIQTSLNDGSALKKFEELVQAHGGNPEVATNPKGVLAIAPHITEVTSPATGFISGFLSKDIGLASLELGAGRKEVTDKVDHSVGVEMCVRQGDAVTEGQPIAKLYHQNVGVDEATKLIVNATNIADVTQPTKKTRILEVLR